MTDTGEPDPTDDRKGAAAQVLTVLGSVSSDLARLDSSVRERVWFSLERFLLRGPASRLLVLIAAVGLISLIGGGLVRLADPEFATTGDAIWWAFLRLTDPGYLGDDHGFWRALISTVLTVAGYVFFMGALVAILTQWLNQRISELELGLRPISMEGHVVVLGWGARSLAVIEGLVRSGRRGELWLKQNKRRRLRIAALVDRLTPDHVQDLRDVLERDYDHRAIVLRTGSALRLDHLRRVDVGNADAVVIPATHGTKDAHEVSSDARIIKTALTLAAFIEPEYLPTLVVEVGDERKIEAARRVYPGKLAAVPSDRLVASVLARSLVAPGIARVFADLLAPGKGASTYIRHYPGLIGKTLDEARDRLPDAVVVGLVRRGLTDDEVDLTLAADHRLEDDDHIVLAASDFDATEPDEPVPLPEVRPGTVSLSSRAITNVMLLGWNRLAPELIEELAREDPPPKRVTVISMVPIERRLRELEDQGFGDLPFELVHYEAPFTRMSTLRRHEVHQADGIVILASEWHATGEQADAHTLTALVLLVQLFEDARIDEADRPPIAVELSDEDNAALVGGGKIDAITGSVVLSHALAQAVLDPAFAKFLEEALSARSGMTSLPATDLLPAGKHSFAEIQAHCRAAGWLALGLVERASGRSVLAPSRTDTFELDEGWKVVALRRTKSGA